MLTPQGPLGVRNPIPSCRAKEEFIGSRGIVSYKNGRRSTVKFTRIALATALALKQAPVRLHEQTTLAQQDRTSRPRLIRMSLQRWART